MTSRLFNRDSLAGSTKIEPTKMEFTARIGLKRDLYLHLAKDY